MTNSKTIKSRAQELLVQVDFIDCYGRPIGLDYATILATIRREFPRSRTTKNALRYIYNNLDRSRVRLPARHRSRKILAGEYIKSLLLVSPSLSRGSIFDRVYRKFSDAPLESRSSRRIDFLEQQLIRGGFKVPTRD